MQEEEDRLCSNCGIRCDQTLMLICDHNLCMNCAAENLVRHENPGINKTQFVICDICQTKTEIDTNTSKEILTSGLKDLRQKLNNKNKNFSNYEPHNTFPDNVDNIHLNTSISNNTFQCQVNNTSPVNFDYMNNNLSNKFNILDIKDNISRTNVCRDHGEPITYLCIDCMSKCICSECVVHGIHKNHEVLNIKKAYPLIYNKTQEIGYHIGGKIKELYSTQKNIEQKKKDINLLNNKCKIDVRQAFDELRSLLNKKEKEIIDKTENTLNDNINELNTYNHIIQSKILLLNKLVETVNAYLMRKDELNLINFYTENKNKILAQTDLTEINNINNLNIDMMPRLKLEIDKSSFDAMISAINMLNFEIDSFKGIDISNQYNLGKFSANRNIYGKSENLEKSKSLEKSNNNLNEIKNESKNIKNEKNK